jgi:transposase-like protein
MSLTLTDVSKLTEAEARATFERVRWPNGPVCHRCGSVEVTELAGEAHRVGLYKCRGCEEQFSSTTGTILEQSHLPIRTWLMAFAILCSAKKGVSALQLQRQLELGSYRTAWHLCHRIRHAMSQEPLVGLLGKGGGTVEVDEAYIGGKPRHPQGPPKGPKHSRRGRGTKKTPVVALVERGGRARSWPVKHVDSATLKAAIREHVDPSARIVTDELNVYQGIGAEFEGGHETVNHSEREYARGDVNTNTIEGYFALLKRGVYGSFHHVSPQHLHRYCDEFSFRWDHRKITDSDRTARAIKGGEGKRLKYRNSLEESHSDD